MAARLVRPSGRHGILGRHLPRHRRATTVRRCRPSGTAPPSSSTTSRGNGPAVLLMHAGVTDRRSWVPLTEHLGDGYRTIAYDRRGFGETRYEPEPHDPVADAIAVLDAEGADRCRGDRCVERRTVEHRADARPPERVSSLVLIGAGTRGGPEDDPTELSEEVQALWRAYEAAEEGDDLDALNRIEAHAWLDGWSAPEGRVQGPIRDLFLEMNAAVLAAPDPGPEQERPPAWDLVAAIEVPTLVLFGALDVVLPRRQRALRRVDRRRSPGGARGHRSTSPTSRATPAAWRPSRRTCARPRPRCPGAWPRLPRRSSARPLASNALSGESTSLSHLPALDGLRGVAVALVVGYHLSPSALPGGFLGVDIFFVLSGFLITSLAITEVRRARGVPPRRVLPAADPAAPARAAPAAPRRSAVRPGVGQDVELDRLRDHSLWTLGYLANWRFIADGTTYTDALYGQSPLRHTWSLAIEEQFYIVFPLLVLGSARCVRWRAEALRWAIGAVAVVGALASATWMAVLWGDGSRPVSRLLRHRHARALAAGGRAARASCWSAGRCGPGPPARLVAVGALVGALGLVGGRHGEPRGLVGPPARRLPRRRARHGRRHRRLASGSRRCSGLLTRRAAHRAGPHLLRRLPLALAGHHRAGRSAHRPRAASRSPPCESASPSWSR